MSMAKIKKGAEEKINACLYSLFFVIHESLFIKSFVIVHSVCLIDQECSLRFVDAMCKRT